MKMASPAQISRRVSQVYKGPLRAAILEWSGITADRYVMAPALVFVEMFKAKDIPLLMSEARQHMGQSKKTHLKSIMAMDTVRERWNKKYGRDPHLGDINEMFDSYIPTQMKCIPRFAGLIDGFKPTVDALHSHFNMKIGYSGGYARPMVDIFLKEAKKQGFKPDMTVAGDEVAIADRPKPFMVYRNMELLNIKPVQSVVKVGDTESGIQEGLLAGCWSVGVARWSNYMDMKFPDQECDLSDKEFEERLERSRRKLAESGAHYVIDTIADLPEICADINKRMANGENP